MEFVVTRINLPDLIFEVERRPTAIRAHFECEPGRLLVRGLWRDYGSLRFAPPEEPRQALAS